MAEELPEPKRVEIVIPTSTVRLTRTELKATPDLILWWLIKKSTDALGFNNYKLFMDYVLCGDKNALDQFTSFERKRIVKEDDGKKDTYVKLKDKRFLPFTDTDAYRLLKVATEAFLAVNCGVQLDLPKGNITAELNDILEQADAADDDIVNRWYTEYLKKVNGDKSLTLPYLALILKKLPDAPIKQVKDIFGETDYPEKCIGILKDKLTNPCLLELIWSYWHEEGMLVQTLNAISRRFQNIRGPAERDPLAMLEFDPLRPLNNLLWGYVQDEQHRLSLMRRVYEYDHHYGLRLEGQAVKSLSLADSRNKFLEAFHNLLYLCSVFYKQDDDTTVIADGFPVLNALKDVHLLLTEGQHNQFGELPATARIEMLMQQWLLARPEFREVLPTRIMVAYPEPWMDRVDAMKKLQGWIDTSVLHFRNLGTYGEQILLSVRFGAWNDTDERNQAAIWARFWRSQIQGYIHAYRTVTGVDLTASSVWEQQRSLVIAQPSMLLRQRLQSGAATPQLPAGTSAVEALPPFRERQRARRQQS